MVSGVIRCVELESEVRLPRTRMVARQPIHADFTEIGFPGGIETWGTRIRGPFASKLIGRPGTNGNRVHWKQAFLRYLDAGNTNPAPKHLENPLVDREPMKIEFAGKLLRILDWKNNLRLVFTSHIGGGLERVDASINTTSRCCREHQLLENLFLGSKRTFEIALDAEGDLPYSYRMTGRWKRQIYHVRSSNIITTDTELKIVVRDVQRQITAISTENHHKTHWKASD